jgi:hypothetical protein
MSSDHAKVPAPIASATELATFLAAVRSLPAAGRGRLLFALDATASRQPNWDRAAELQAEMFSAAAGLGGIEIQLAYYRGFGQFQVSTWLADPGTLARMMSGVFCLSGRTQIGKVLQHAINVARGGRLSALVFVGDCMEEDAEALCARAGELGLLGVRGFFFLEGDNPAARDAFAAMARLTGGAFCRFDAGAAEVLRALLRAVATYAAGGASALDALARHAGGETARVSAEVTAQIAGRRPGR